MAEPKHRFEAVLEQDDQTSGTGVLIPLDVPELFGARGRVPVRGTLNGAPSRVRLCDPRGEEAGDARAANRRNADLARATAIVQIGARMKTVTLVRASVALSLLVSPVAFAQSDAVIGTWKLNLAKSKYDPGPAPLGSTLTFEAAGDGIKVTAKGQDAKGTPTSTQYTATTSR